MLKLEFEQISPWRFRLKMDNDFELLLYTSRQSEITSPPRKWAPEEVVTKEPLHALLSRKGIAIQDTPHSMSRLSDIILWAAETAKKCVVPS